MNWSYYDRASSQSVSSCWKGRKTYLSISPTTTRITLEELNCHNWMYSESVHGISFLFILWFFQKLLHLRRHTKRIGFWDNSQGQPQRHGELVGPCTDVCMCCSFCTNCQCTYHSNREVVVDDVERYRITLLFTVCCILCQLNMHPPSATKKQVKATKK